MNSIEEHRIFDDLREFRRLHSLGRGSRILVALSGGPDSTALLSVFTALRKELELVVGCAYVNHGLRSPADLQKEEDHIEWCGKTFSVPVHHKRFSPGLIKKYAREKSCGIEAAARLFRYGYLRKIQARESYDYIAFGHTEDDQIETVVSRFMQGSGPEGIAGIPEAGKGLIRPFLRTGKELILDYLQKAGIPYVLDSTNSDNDFMRNAVRNTLIPVLEKIFPGFPAGIKAVSGKMEELADFVRRESLQAIEWYNVPASGRTKLRTNYSTFVDSHPVLRKDALYRCINTTGKRDVSRIPERFITDLDRRIAEKKDNGDISRGYGCAFSRYGDFLFANSDVVFPEKKGYLVVVDSSETEIINQSGFQIQKTLLSSNVEKAVWLFDYIEMYPLLIRSWRSKDTVAGRIGRKDVRKLFQEWNVPDELKWEIPIIEDRAGIRAVFGSFFGFPDRYRDPSREDSRLETDNILVFSYSKDGSGL